MSMPAMLPRIGLMGRARTGKDTAAGLLVPYGYTRLAFAEPLRDLAVEVDPYVGVVDGRAVRYTEAVMAVGYERAKDDHLELRRVLQRLGTGARHVLGDSVWVDALAALVDAMPVWAPVVVTDVRFPNEAERLRQLGFVMVRLTRTAAPPAGEHVSETALDRVPADVTYANDGTVEDLRRFLVSKVLGSEARQPGPPVQMRGGEVSC